LKPLNVLAWSIALTAALAAILSAAIVWLVEREHAGEEWVRHSRAVNDQTAQLLLVVQRIESSQRGYLLTGRNLYLGNYNDEEKELPALLDETARLVADNRRQQETFAELRQVIIEKMRELRSTVDEQRAGRPDAARAIVNSDRGLKMMDEIRLLFSEMKDEEHQVLSNRLSALGRVGTLLQVGAPIPFVMICAIGVLTRLYMRRSLAELEQNQMRLRLGLDAAQLGWWQYDPLSDMILGDARLKEIFDFTADETPLEEFIKRVHPDDLARVWADREAALDPTDPKPYAHEYRIQRRDGEVRWVETHGLAYFEGGGRQRRPVSFGGTVQDITERKKHEEGRKKREENEHLLMREVNHRAKNMLSVVDAIAHQTVAGSPEDYVGRFSERIQALSANQDLLIKNAWHGVEIDDLVRAQLAPFADLLGSRIAMRGPKLRLNAASAQAIGLALHELTTNAGKYGALSTDKGRADIGWGTEGDTFTVSWTERDGPPVSAPQRRGFGSVVMKEMAERSVDGRVELDYAPSGVTWRLTSPAVNALESVMRLPES
jgi:PAS domain S-box-containing protein